MAGQAAAALEVTVRDLERSLAHYRALGFTFVRRGPGGAVVRWGETALWLQPEDERPAAEGRPRVALRLVVADLDALLARLQEDGLNPDASVDRFYDTSEVTVVDPDGFAVRFVAAALI